MYTKNDEFAITSFRNCEIEQQCRFGFTEDKIKPLIDNWSVVDSYAYIIHNPEDDEDTHIHLMLAFKNPVPTFAILNYFEGCGIEFQHINKIKSHRFSSAVAYLTHENKPEKEQYSRDCVVSKNLDIDKLIDDELKIINNKRYNFNELFDKIENGDIKEYNITQYVPIDIYSKNRVRIENAFRYRQNKLHYELRGNRNMQCVFISGPTACGKTTFAKQFAEDYGLSYFVSSGGKNPLDDYKGQECIILDDLRDDETFSFADLLKLTDNNTQSFVGCRYNNKAIYECKLIIATSTKRIEHFFYEQDEDKNQLFRRFSDLIVMEEKTMSLYHFDVSRLEYVLIKGDMINPIYALKMSGALNSNLSNRLLAFANKKAFQEGLVSHDDFETIPENQQAFDNSILDTPNIISV